MHSTMDLPLTYLTEVRSILEPEEGKASLEPSMHQDELSSIEQCSLGNIT